MDAELFFFVPLNIKMIIEKFWWQIWDLKLFIFFPLSDVFISNEIFFKSYILWEEQIESLSQVS